MSHAGCHTACGGRTIAAMRIDSLLPPPTEAIRAAILHPGGDGVPATDPAPWFR